MSPSMLKWFRLTKPGVVLLLQITAISAVVVHDLMTEVRPSFAHTLEASLITLVGGYLTAGGSNAINMWYDRDIDPKMKRTSKRPVPAGDIDANHALLFGVTISLLGVLWFNYTAGEVAAFWSAFSILFYVFVYTIWLKRRTVQNIVIGGFAGSTPPLIGWFVAKGPSDLDLGSLSGFLSSISDTGSLIPFYMLGVIFIWTPPHFWALALYRSGEYGKVNIPMLNEVKGAEHTVFQSKVYCVLLLMLGSVPCFWPESGLPLLWAFVSGGLTVWYAASVWAIDPHEPFDENGRMPKAAKSFFRSLFYLGWMFLSLVVIAFIPPAWLGFLGPL